MADDKQKYNRNLTTTHGDKVTTTEHGDKTVTTTRSPKVTTRTEQSVGGYYDANGNPNIAAQREFEAQKRPVAAAYGIDPNTGRVDHRFVSEILGVDPDIMRRKRAEEERLNQSKQKESALYNSLAVLGDMITTAGGGNVWLRNADQHAKQAHDDNIALQKEQQAEDIANNDKLRSVQQAYAAAVQKIYDTIGKSYSTKVSRTTEQGGNTVAKTTQGQDISTTTQGNDRTTGYTEGRAGNGSRSGGGGSGSGGSNVRPLMNVRATSSGKIHSFELTKPQFDAVTSLLKEHYTQLLNSNNPTFADDIKEKLSKAHILIGTKEDGTPIFDYNMMLQNGNYYELSNSVAHKIEEITGNKIVFPRHTADKANTTTANTTAAGWQGVNDEFDF